MQITGQTCAVSGERIMMESEGIGCLLCDAAYLRSAIDGTTCPRCQQDMAAMKAQALLSEQSRVDSLQSRGRARYIYVGVCVVLVFLSSIAVFLMHARNGRMGGLPGLGGFLSWVWAWRGHRGARWWLKGLVLLNFGICTLMLLMTTAVKGMSGAALFAVVAYPVVMTVAMLIAVIFMFSPALNLYLEDQRAYRQGQL